MHTSRTQDTTDLQQPPEHEAGSPHGPEEEEEERSAFVGGGGGGGERNGELNHPDRNGNWRRRTGLDEGPD